MASAEAVHQWLSIAARLLDRAAAGIRDAQLEPVRDNLEGIGKALAEVFEIQLRIEALHPALATVHEQPSPEVSAANRLLMNHMVDASEFERRGNIVQAVATCESFMALESTLNHRDIVAAELDRLRRQCSE